MCVLIANLPVAAVAAQSSGTPIVSLEIRDQLTALGAGGALRTYDDRYQIEPAGKGYVRVSGRARAAVESLPPGVVDNFLQLVALWRYPKPTPRALGLSLIQSRTLLADLQAQCGYGGDLTAALSAYYAEATIWADDYPSVAILIIYKNGQVSRITSHNQQLFGLPWRAATARGRESLSFDAELSRALLPLLGKTAVNGKRFDGYVPGLEPFLEVAGVACHSR